MPVRVREGLGDPGEAVQDVRVRLEVAERVERRVTVEGLGDPGETVRLGVNVRVATSEALEEKVKVRVGEEVRVALCRCVGDGVGETERLGVKDAEAGGEKLWVTERHILRVGEGEQVAVWLKVVVLLREAVRDGKELSVGEGVKEGDGRGVADLVGGDGVGVPVGVKEPAQLRVRDGVKEGGDGVMLGEGGDWVWLPERSGEEVGEKVPEPLELGEQLFWLSERVRVAEGERAWEAVVLGVMVGEEVPVEEAAGVGVRVQLSVAVRLKVRVT